MFTRLAVSRKKYWVWAGNSNIAIVHARGVHTEDSSDEGNGIRFSQVVFKQWFFQIKRTAAKEHNSKTIEKINDGQEEVREKF